MTRVRRLVASAFLAIPTVLGTAQAGAAPALPDSCVPADVVDNVCTLRLGSVTADVVNGTITGAPVGGGSPITLAGQAFAYQRSAGFGATPPDAIGQWDAEIVRVGSLDTDPSDPNWYGNAKAVTFLPRTLNGFATQFPPDVLVVQFTPDEARPDAYHLVSIQPTAQ